MVVFSRRNVFPHDGASEPLLNIVLFFWFMGFERYLVNVDRLRPRFGAVQGARTVPVMIVANRCGGYHHDMMAQSSSIGYLGRYVDKRPSELSPIHLGVQ